MDNADGDSTPAPRRTPPVREDCWSEDATETLVEAWGERFLEVNRGHLRQHQWEEVAATVNSRHGHVSKNRRTDVQCKNRIDTLKKKYKAEKARVDASTSQGTAGDGSVYSSPWRFFSRLDHFIGPSYKPTLSPALPRRRAVPTPPQVPVRPRSKRPAMAEEFYPRQNFSVMAASGDDNGEGEESESGKSRTSRDGRDSPCSGGGFVQVVEAIEKFGDVYLRVEGERQRQMVELEKQRMMFAKDLEIERMKMIVEAQIQMEQLRQSNWRNNNKRARQDVKEEKGDGEGILSSFHYLFNA